MIAFHCPHCDYPQDFSDVADAHAEAGGEDGGFSLPCDRCGHEIFVRAHVTTDYELEE